MVNLTALERDMGHAPNYDRLFMGRQFRVYLLPRDVEELTGELRSKAGLRILQENSPNASPIEMNSPIRSHSLLHRWGCDQSVRCYLSSDVGAKVNMTYLPHQERWNIDLSSEVIEFSGCDFGRDTLMIGRMYFQNDFLLGDKIWKKRSDFLAWADNIFRIAKKTLRRSRVLDAYVGKAAKEWAKHGGKFAALIARDGTPLYEDSGAEIL